MAVWAGMGQPSSSRVMSQNSRPDTFRKFSRSFSRVTSECGNKKQFDDYSPGSHLNVETENNSGNYSPGSRLNVETENNSGDYSPGSHLNVETENNSGNYSPGSHLNVETENNMMIILQV